jgi:hypothetical protein
MIEHGTTKTCYCASLCNLSCRILYLPNLVVMGATFQLSHMLFLLLGMSWWR